MGTTNLNACNSPLYDFYLLWRPSKRHTLQVLRLDMRRRRIKEERKKEMMGAKTEMEMKNLKLYMENKSIIKENEKLKKKAFLLHQENQVLLSQLQNKSPFIPCNHIDSNQQQSIA
ncbi:hypothetical protein CFOL_v3_19159 [Cephalotus follicularis]|uniref:Uncharacterized protein n=1 Tax=Cephalotus follicularis TaxID=3775 RepID=A0A1Q3C6E0_CEPFO|nr:hypothetical protein CFOL_v3_19159 [Cephalotus follicularis]